MRNSEEGELEACGDTGLVKDVGQVALHSFLAQSELFCNVAVAAAFHDAAHHFKLAGGETVGLALRHHGLLHEVMKGRNQVDHALAANPVIAPEDGADGRLQVAGERVFEHDAAGADVQGLDDLLGGDRGGEQQDFHCWRAVHNGPHGLKAGQPWHLQVEEKNIGLELECPGDGFVAIIGFADYFEAVHFSEHIAHADTNHWMVVCQHDSD